MQYALTRVDAALTRVNARKRAIKTQVVIDPFFGVL